MIPGPDIFIIRYVRESALQNIMPDVADPAGLTAPPSSVAE
jgi:hypothetical protein